MRQPARRPRAALVLALLLLLAGAAGVVAAPLPALFSGPNPSGLDRTITTVAGATDNPFFQNLGTNGRTCATCHTPLDGWSITPPNVQARFQATRGLDPLFRPNDGANSPLADVSTPAARRIAYSLLLTKALIRVGMPMPAGAEFSLTSVDDPYGFASAAELSLFRRPLPATNLRFLTSVMWDGRETFADQPMRFNLAHQANGATVGHAQGASLPSAVLDRIVDLEASLLTAQVVDRIAGSLYSHGAQGGPEGLRYQAFWPGINSSADPTGAVPTRNVFTMFDAWASAVRPYSAARQSIARGQALFNARAFGSRGSTCSSCHNTPNVGSSSNGLFFNIGLSDEGRRTPDLPLYTFLCTTGTRAGQEFRTSDPGLALITGKCSDLSRFKVPVLRGLASRAPYFHNGAAPTLAAVVDVYDEVFAIGLTGAEKADLTAFLRAL